jgi:hypothetical protein
LERLARRMPGSETRLVAVENEAEAAQVRREALAAGDMRDLIVIITGVPRRMRPMPQADHGSASAPPP